MTGRLRLTNELLSLLAAGLNCHLLPLGETCVGSLWPAKKR